MNNRKDFSKDSEALDAMIKAFDFTHGTASLELVYKNAQLDNENTESLRLFLLGLYDSISFPLDISLLRAMDKDLLAHCLTVLTLDCFSGHHNLHTFVPGMANTLEEWANSRKDFLTKQV